MEIPLIVGGGLVVIGVGIGIGQIGKGAMEALKNKADACPQPSDQSIWPGIAMFDLIDESIEIFDVNDVSRSRV